MNRKLMKSILAAGIALSMIGCRKIDKEKTEEEIMEEMANEPEIIIPDEPVETIEPQEGPAEVEIEEGEEGSF